MTKLEDSIEMTKERILKGEPIEFPKVKDKKTRRDKDVVLYKGSIVDPIMGYALSDLADAYRSIDSLAQERDDTKKTLTELQEDNKKAKTQLNQLNMVLERQNSMEKDLSEATSELKKKADQLTDLETNLQNTNKRLATANQKLAETQDKLTDMRGKYDEKDTQLQEVSDKLKQAQDDVQESQNDLITLADSVNSIINTLAARYKPLMDSVKKRSEELGIIDEDE